MVKKSKRRLTFCDVAIPMLYALKQCSQEEQEQLYEKLLTFTKQPEVCHKRTISPHKTSKLKKATQAKSAIARSKSEKFEPSDADFDDYIVFTDPEF